MERPQLIEQNIDLMGPLPPKHPVIDNQGENSLALLNVAITPLEPHRDNEIIEIIRKNLSPFEDTGRVIASALRRLDQFQDVYRSERAKFLSVVDKTSGKLIGGAGIGPFAGLSPDEKIGEIRELVITPEHRGRGIGRVLLYESLEVARQLGYSRIYLETTPQMTHAQRLFRRFDFIPVTEKQDRDGNPIKTVGLPCYYVLEKL